MATIAIVLSAYLLRHQSFTVILDMENDFGIVLGVLLGAIIITSLVWLVVGKKRQFRLVSYWNKRYGDYITLEIWQRLRLNMTSSRNIKLELEYAD